MYIVQNVRDLDNRVILADNCMLKVHRKNGENSQHDKNEACFIAIIVNCDYILPHLSNVTNLFLKSYLFACYSSIIYLFKFNNRNTRKYWEICSMLKVKTTEQRQDAYFKYCYCVLVIDFKHMNSLRERFKISLLILM